MSLETSGANFIVAITEGRGHDVGIAALNRNTATMTLTQISDCATYIKTIYHLHLHTPASILIPDNYLSSNPKHTHTILLRSLQAEFPDARFERVPRKYWNSQFGLERVAELCVKDESRTVLLVVIRDKYYALCSAAALLRFFSQDMNILFTNNSVRISYTAVEGSLFVDSATAKGLELVENMSTKTVKQSLFRILNYTFTDMGKRLLRSNLLAPPRTQSTIDARHEAVDEIIHKEDMYNAIRESFRPLQNTDFDTILSSLVTSQIERTAKARVSCFSNRVTQMLKIRDLLQCLPVVCSAISTSSSTLLKLLSEILNDNRFTILQNMVSQTFNDDLPFYKKSNRSSLHIYVYAVQANINRLLDVARETFRENLSDIHQLCQDLTEKHGFQIHLDHSVAGTYSFSLKRNTLSDLQFPEEFIHITTKGNKVSFSTLELKKKNARIKDALDEIMILSDRVVEELLDKILENVAVLYKGSEAIALLDLLWSFAHVSISCLIDFNLYAKQRIFIWLFIVRPEFTGVIAIKGGRHPILSADPTFKATLVSNDAYCCSSAHFQLIQGANMSGKTTYIKQVALLVILAMCGCFVPAEYASFKLHDALFTLFSGDNSNVDYSLSTFGSEMATAATILGILTFYLSKNVKHIVVDGNSPELATSHSLVVLDEIGRGTSVSEGLGISFAVAETLLLRKSFVFFITHFQELPRLLGREPSVISLYLLTHKPQKNRPSDLLFKYKIIDGTPENLGHYGMDLATLADIPTSMTEYALRATERVSMLTQEQERKSALRGLIQRRKILLQLRSRLQRVMKFSNLDQKGLLDFLHKIQVDVVIALDTQL